ncbi:MAG: multiheme c-type cytochrome [Polyangiales bacterium]
MARTALPFFAALLTPALGFAQPLGTQPGTLVNPLSPAERCSECHAGGTTASGERYMAADAWGASMMANASRDPLFLATLTVAEQDAPGVGTVCLRCHTPSGFTGGRATPGLGTRLDGLEGDLDGVHCDTCHRSVIPAGVASAPHLANAQIYYSDAPEGSIAPRFGPRDNPVTSPRHPSMGSAFIRDSRLCGQCHNIDHPTNHRLGADGRDTGVAFPLQSTYTEWAQSDFARRAQPETCATCHMPAIPGAALPSTRIPDAPLREGQRRHDFLGANEWGMAMLEAAYPGERDEEYRAMRTRIQTYLRTSARVELLSPPATGAAGSTARVRVKVTNLSGHKLPTGYEDARLMWLQVQVGGTVVSGAFVDDELVEDRQARVYRFQAGRYEGGRATPSDFVARHNTVIEDTRIPPLGMRADARTQPVGRDYSGGEGGALRNYDEASFDVTLPAQPGPVPVTVRLMYRSTTKHYVEAIAGANRTDMRGRELLRVWNASGRAAPFSVAEATAMVTVTPAVAPEPEGGCSTRPTFTGRAGIVGFAGLALVVGAAARRRRRRA